MRRLALWLASLSCIYDEEMPGTMPSTSFFNGRFRFVFVGLPKRALTKSIYYEKHIYVTRQMCFCSLRFCSCGHVHIYYA